MRRGLISAVVAMLALGACTLDPEIEQRPLVVRTLRACPVAQSEAFSVVYANGDFETSGSTVASLFLREVGRELTGLPAGTRSLIVDVSHPSKSIDWRGTAMVPPSGPVDVLVWPGGEVCEWSRNVESRANPSFAVFGHHAMIAGAETTGGAVPLTFVADLRTGVLQELELGVATRRTRATITAFRKTPGEEPSSALVAGGEDPDTGAPLATAEIYTPNPSVEGAIGDFERERIDLTEARTKHGAVELVTGETLLVGGIGVRGTPIGTMEIVDPKTRRSRSAGVQSLEAPRSSPTVLRLASGEILVAGGIGERNVAVTTLEWFSPDARTRTKRSVGLVSGAERSFVALDSGGALAVVSPSGAAPDFSTVWVISADGSLASAIPLDPALLEKVRLFPGANGAPVLWTGERWLRWEPWFGTFKPISDGPFGTRVLTDGTRIANGPVGSAIANGDSGLALWLDDRAGAMFLRGYRFDTRSAYGAAPNPMLVESTIGLAPDRLAGLPGSSISFTKGRGLEMREGASAFVTDLTFADVNVDVDFVDQAAAVVLRQTNGRELSVGGAECAIAQTAKKSLHVERIKRRVTVTIDGTDTRTCPTELDEGTRVAIGLRGLGGPMVSAATNLRVVRR